MGPFIADWWYLIAAGLIVLALAVWLGLAEARDKSARLGLATGWGLVIGLAASPFAITAVGTTKADALWELYAVFLGTVLLLAFFQPQWAFVLRGFQRVTEVVFFPRSKLWLLGFGALMVGAGFYGLARRLAV
jgi:hypothetical protein